MQITNSSVLNHFNKIEGDFLCEKNKISVILKYLRLTANVIKIEIKLGKEKDRLRRA